MNSYRSRGNIFVLLVVALLAAKSVDRWPVAVAAQAETQSTALHCADVVHFVSAALQQEKNLAGAELVDLLSCAGVKTALEDSAGHDNVIASALPSFPNLWVASNASADALDTLALVVEHGTLPLRTVGSSYAELFSPPARARAAWELRELAAKLGNARSQAVRALALSYGLTPPAVDANSQPFDGFAAASAAEAFVHYYFAAAGNDSFANMVLGFRHSVGAGAPQSCPAAVLYYQLAADRVIELAAKPDGLPEIEYVRLSALQTLPKRVADKDVLQLYRNSADMGNANAATIVGDLLNHGTPSTPRNHVQAFEYFKQAAAAGDVEAMAHLGHMYANGLVVQQNNKTAVDWFLKAVEGTHPSPSALFGLGYMYLTGHGVARDYAKALDLLTRATQFPDRRRSEAHFHLAVMHLNGWGLKKPSPEMAEKMFAQAAYEGHVLATYNLAMMQLAGTTRQHTDCRAALKNLMKVAQRGPELRHLGLALKRFQERDYHGALWHYLFAAEMGIEVAMSNAAWIIDRGLVAPTGHASAVALRLHRAAAAADNLEALLAIGDAYYSGVGARRSAVTAATYYREACRPGAGDALQFKHAFSQASFNLGVMHQFGIGMPLDHHLSKRFYDQALDTFPEARWAVRLALLSLRVHGRLLAVSKRFPGAARAVHTLAQNAFDWLYHHARALLDPVYAHHTNGTVLYTEFFDGSGAAADGDSAGSLTADDGEREPPATAVEGGGPPPRDGDGVSDWPRATDSGDVRSPADGTQPAGDPERFLEDLTMILGLLAGLVVLLCLRLRLRATRTVIVRPGGAPPGVPGPPISDASGRGGGVDDLASGSAPVAGGADGARGESAAASASASVGGSASRADAAHADARRSTGVADDGRPPSGPDGVADGQIDSGGLAGDAGLQPAQGGGNHVDARRAAAEAAERRHRALNADAPAC